MVTFSLKKRHTYSFSRTHTAKHLHAQLVSGMGVSERALVAHGIYSPKCVCV